jgi:Phosphotransferase enzyme family
MMSADKLTVPATLESALDPGWLAAALAPVIGGAPIERVEIVELIRTMATKVRFRIEHADGAEALCLKGFLDADPTTARGGPTMIREADFYDKIASHVPMRLAECVAGIVNREAQQGLIIMRDLVAGGARMCSALNTFDADEVAGTLDQLAGLHAGAALLEGAPWIDHRIANMAGRPHLSPADIQQLFDGPRGDGLSKATCNAECLIRALKELAVRDAERPHTIIHGDCHAGNVYLTDRGPGFLDWQLVQRGSWALDVAYHINALLPVAVAEKEDANLLRYYLDAARQKGANVPRFDEAQAQYREALVYGYYLWAITRRVDPVITNLCNNRLGMAVSRHESYQLLGQF